MQRNVITFTSTDELNFIDAVKNEGFTEEILSYEDGMLLKKPGTDMYILITIGTLGETSAAWYFAIDFDSMEWKDECEAENSIMPFAGMEIDGEPFFLLTPTDELAVIRGLGLVHLWGKALEKTASEWAARRGN